MRSIAIALISLAASAVSQAALVSFDFTGTNPGQNTPWTTTSSIDANVTLSQGFALQGAPGAIGAVWGAAGNDSLNLTTRAGTGGTRTTLADAIAANTYTSFIMAPKPGYSLNLAGATISFDLLYANNTYYWGPWRLDALSSIEGFSSSKSLATATVPYDWIYGNKTATATMPNTAAYTGITTPVEFRFYFSAQGYDNKPTGIDNVVIGGTTAPVPEPTAVAAILSGASLLVLRKRAR